MKIRIPIPFTNPRIELKSHDPASPAPEGAWQVAFGPIPLKLKRRGVAASEGGPSSGPPRNNPPTFETTRASAPSADRRLRDQYPVVEDLSLGGSSKTTLYRKAALPSPDACIGVVVKEALGAKSQAQAHLEAEAQAHEAIQRHVGPHPTLSRHLFTSRGDDGQLQIATQYVDGPVLARFAAHMARKEAKGKIPPDEAALMRRLVAKDVLSGLSAVASAGYYHGDVNDNNVIVGSDGMAKLIDFGLARRQGQVPAQAHGAWHPGEYAKRRPGDERSDVYMLGVLLKQFYLGGGRLQGVYGLPSEESLPADLREAIAGMTQPDINDRWTLDQARRSAFFSTPIPDEDRIRGLLGKLAGGSA